MSNEYRGLGLNGGEYVNDTTAKTGDWFAIVATEDTVLASIDSNVTNLNSIASSTVLSANTAIYGSIKGFQLTSGAVIAYNR